MRVAILTISDRSSQGERADLSGPLLTQRVEAQDWEVVQSGIVSDDANEIIDTLTAWADEGDVDLILTTGGTGFAPRDMAPEATRVVIQRETPGLVEAMRAASLKITPHAMLSRAAAGIRRQTLIINLPGSPKAADENLAVVLPVLPHAVELLRDDPGAESGHHSIKSFPQT